MSGSFVASWAKKGAALWVVVEEHELLLQGCERSIVQAAESALHRWLHEAGSVDTDGAGGDCGGGPGS